VGYDANRSPLCKCIVESILEGCYGNIYENCEVKRELNRVVHKLNAITYDKCQGPYSLFEAPNIREANMEPHQW
jgi:hypothetical protein